MFDLILRGGRVLDGAGNVDVRADVAVEGGRIAAIGQLAAAEARETVDVTGLTVCPGFVDVHCHSDALPFAADPLPAKILQGVTTEVNGNCGSTAFPLLPETAELLKEHQAGLFADTPWDWMRASEFFASLERAGPVSNIAQLVGHGALRVAAFGFQNRRPTDDELKTMQRLLAESLEDGAVGLSSGLIYSPGFYSQTAELIALAEVMRGSGRPYCSHVRGETATLFQAHAEAIEIGERNDIPVQHSHLKAAGQANHGRAGELLALLEQARDRGVEVTGDAYPYDAGSTRMAALLPPWSQEGGRELLLERLTIPSERERIKQDFQNGSPAGRTWPARAAGTRSGCPAWTRTRRTSANRSRRSPMPRGRTLWTRSAMCWWRSGAARRSW